MRKILLSLLVVAGITVGCDKNTEWEQNQELRIANLEAGLSDTNKTIAQIEADLLATIELLKQQIAENSNNITANAEMIERELAILTSNLELLAATSAEADDELRAVLAGVEDALNSLITEFNSEIELIKEDLELVNGDVDALEYNFNQVVEGLRAEIVAAQEAAEAYADANDAVGITSIPDFGAQIDIVIADLDVVEDSYITKVDLNNLIEDYLNILGGVNNQIEALRTAVDGFSNEDYATVLELQAEIDTLRTQLQDYADNNDDDTVFNSDQIDADIADLLSKLEELEFMINGVIGFDYEVTGGTATASLTYIGTDGHHDYYNDTVNGYSARHNQDGGSFHGKWTLYQAVIPVGSSDWISGFLVRGGFNNFDTIDELDDIIVDRESGFTFTATYNGSDLPEGFSIRWETQGDVILGTDMTITIPNHTTEGVKLVILKGGEVIGESDWYLVPASGVEIDSGSALKRAIDL